MEIKNKKMVNPERKKLREAVEKRLESVKFDPKNRLNLDERLDQLLFDYDRMGYKHFAYTGKSLCKIDLSKADFKNAMFDSKEKTDLSNTNAKIVFNETFFTGGILRQNYTIEGVNFSGVDLSKSVSSHNESQDLEFYFNGCDLSNTGLRVRGDQFHFVDCNLTGMDLRDTTLVCKYLRSDRHVDMINGTEYKYSVCARNCNLSNTGALIVAEDEELKTDIQRGAHGAIHEWISVKLCEYLAKQKIAGHLEGCDVIMMGVDIDAEVAKIKEAEKTPKKIVEEARIMGIIDETIKAIDTQLEQIRAKKPKKVKKMELVMPSESNDGDMVDLPFEI